MLVIWGSAEGTRCSRLCFHRTMQFMVKLRIPMKVSDAAITAISIVVDMDDPPVLPELKDISLNFFQFFSFLKIPSSVFTTMSVFKRTGIKKL